MINKYTSNNIYNITPTHNLFLISWHVTGWCNFHCPYCIDGRNKSEFTSEENVIQVAKNLNTFILNNVSEDQQVKLRLYGGEPSFYNWPLILENISRIDILVLPTNFSRPLQYYQDLYMYCISRKIKLILNCSCHPEEKNFVAKMIMLTNWCREQTKLNPKSTFITPINTFVIDNNFDFKIIETLENCGVVKLKLTNKRDLVNKKVKLNSFCEQKINEYTNKYSKASKYADFIVDFVDGHSENFVNSADLINRLDEGGFDPTGFLCDVGVNSIAIESNGDIVLARCEYLRNKVIGNISDSNFRLDKKTFECKLNENNTDNRCALCFNNVIKRKD